MFPEIVSSCQPPQSPHSKPLFFFFFFSPVKTLKAETPAPWFRASIVRRVIGHHYPVWVMPKRWAARLTSLGFKFYLLRRPPPQAIASIRSSTPRTARPSLQLGVLAIRRKCDFAATALYGFK